MKDHVQGGKKVLLDKSYLVVQVSDNSQEDVSRFISEVEYTLHSQNVKTTTRVVLKCI